MHVGVNEFLEEQAKGLADMVRNIRKARAEAARRAAIESAARIKALNGRVLDLARGQSEVLRAAGDARKVTRRAMAAAPVAPKRTVRRKAKSRATTKAKA